MYGDWLSTTVKSKLISITFSMVSILVIVYYLIDPISETKYRHGMIGLIYPLVAGWLLLINLLLYQAVLCIPHTSLHYWPHPRVAIIVWIMSHSILFIVLVCGMVYIFHCVIMGLPIAHNVVDVTFRGNLIMLGILCLLEAMLIVYGISIAKNLLQELSEKEERNDHGSFSRHK